MEFIQIIKITPWIRFDYRTVAIVPNGAVTHLKITEHSFYELNNKNALTSVTF